MKSVRNFFHEKRMSSSSNLLGKNQSETTTTTTTTTINTSCTTTIVTPTTPNKSQPTSSSSSPLIKMSPTTPSNNSITTTTTTTTTAAAVTTAQDEILNEITTTTANDNIIIANNNSNNKNDSFKNLNKSDQQNCDLSATSTTNTEIIPKQTTITTSKSCSSNIKPSSSLKIKTQPSNSISAESMIVPSSSVQQQQQQGQTNNFMPSNDIINNINSNNTTGGSSGAGTINISIPPPSPSSVSSGSTTPGSATPNLDPKQNRHSAGPFSLFSSKSQKGRRKISLPWFRQNSVSGGHAPLSRQHTIDSPGSFRFFRQASSNVQVGNLEVTWVVSDYTATPGTNELSVIKGQQVEVVEVSSANEPDYCLVRLNPQTDDGAAREGLVPISILKPPPGSQKSTSLRKENDVQEQGNSRAKSGDALSSSSTKRKGFSGRKWLPPPLRKLSQGKVDKPSDRSLIKKNSEKNMRLPEKHNEDDENQMASSTNQNSGQDLEPEEEAHLELPPPMKPIQEPCLISNGPPSAKENSSNMANTFKKIEGNAPPISEIEQIVKEKTEQHEVKSKFLKPAIDVSNSDNSDSLESHYSKLNLNDNNDTDNNDENNAEANDVEAATKKRLCALQELISTEELYIQDLSEIVNGYLAEIRNKDSEIPLPEDLFKKEKIVFINIEQIYEWHRDFFFKALQCCLKTPSELGPMIKKYERKFQMYHIYCQQKPLSEHVVTENQVYFDQVRQKLKHRLDLSDMLIKPVQRITKYELLLKEITKQTERAGFVEDVAGMREAYNVMKVVCKTINDMMDVRRLQKFEGRIAAQGKLLLHGPLLCTEDTQNVDRNASFVQKPRELQVFLFEQSIIFSEIIGKKTQFTPPLYDYRSLIQVNKMTLHELPNNRFLLKSTDPNRTDIPSFICCAPSLEQNREWLETIRNILQAQNDFLRKIQSPLSYPDS